MNISKIKGEIRNVYNKGFFHFLSARFLIRIFGFGSQLFVAWWLTPEDLGDIKILQVYMSILIVLAGFGFNISTLKLCAEKRPETQIRYLFIKYSRPYNPSKPPLWMTFVIYKHAICHCPRIPVTNTMN